MSWWEFTCCVKGYNDRQKSEQKRLAWAICILGNRIPYNKRPLKIDQLIGRDVPEFSTAEEFRKYMDERAGE